MKAAAIVLAAGKGVRMKSDLPKVSHSLCGKPMIVRVLKSIDELELEAVYVVVGYKADIVKSECEDFDVTYIEQNEQLGTGHAVMQARPFVKEPLVIVLNGDVPLLKPETLRNLISYHVSKSASATILTASVPDPTGYGRIIRTDDGLIVRIVEHKDATANELGIDEINTGTYCFNTKELFDALNDVKPNNAQKEYYLTDVISILRKKGSPVYAYKASDHIEVLGVNTKEDLIKLEDYCTNA